MLSGNPLRRMTRRTLESFVKLILFFNCFRVPKLLVGLKHNAKDTWAQGPSTTEEVSRFWLHQNSNVGV